MRVRWREGADCAAVRAFLAAHGSLRVARLGRLEQPLDHPAPLADQDGALAGVVKFVIAAEHGIPIRDERVLEEVG